MTYSVIYETGETGVWARIPDLPGVFSFGKTQSEAESNVREAAALWIEETRSRGEAVPAPTTAVGALDISAA